MKSSYSNSRASELESLIKIMPNQSILQILHELHDDLHENSAYPHKILTKAINQLRVVKAKCDDQIELKVILDILCDFKQSEQIVQELLPCLDRVFRVPTLSQVQLQNSLGLQCGIFTVPNVSLSKSVGLPLNPKQRQLSASNLQEEFFVSKSNNMRSASNYISDYEQIQNLSFKNKLIQYSLTRLRNRLQFSKNPLKDVQTELQSIYKAGGENQKLIQFYNKLIRNQSYLKQFVLQTANLFETSRNSFSSRTSVSNRESFSEPQHSELQMQIIQQMMSPKFIIDQIEAEVLDSPEIRLNFAPNNSTTTKQLNQQHFEEKFENDAFNNQEDSDDYEIVHFEPIQFEDEEEYVEEKKNIMEEGKTEVLKMKTEMNLLPINLNRSRVKFTKE
ncbi:Hypothetical_protein [Hexamita inflata]|uniref:Hypothetical_protein n=1 Tax=Hexamita inflata TaxID=28002 RepID=A0AA86UXS1_9EUKA|nr:Hypothetical protein HINF_LOCUS56401 [Hexamita inflata]